MSLEQMQAQANQEFWSRLLSGWGQIGLLGAGVGAGARGLQGLRRLGRDVQSTPPEWSEAPNTPYFRFTPRPGAKPEETAEPQQKAAAPAWGRTLTKALSSAPVKAPKSVAMPTPKPLPPRPLPAPAAPKPPHTSVGSFPAAPAPGFFQPPSALSPRAWKGLTAAAATPSLAAAGQQLAYPFRQQRTDRQQAAQDAQPLPSYPQFRQPWGKSGGNDQPTTLGVLGEAATGGISHFLQPLADAWKPEHLNRVTSHPLFLPGAVAAGGLGLYGGWKGVDSVLDSVRKQTVQEELDQAQRDYELALRGQLKRKRPGVKLAEAETPDEPEPLELLYKEALGTPDAMGLLQGLALLGAGGAALGTGKLTYDLVRKRQRPALLEKARQRQLRALMDRKTVPILLEPQDYEDPTPPAAPVALNR